MSDHRRSDETLRNRAFAFLREAGVSLDTRYKLHGAGYEEADHQRGWDLLLAGAAPLQPTPDTTELRRWYEQWSAVARTVITQRIVLIRLGLARRRKRRRTSTDSAGSAR